MKVLVGLGNPGLSYKITRHNVGFLFLDYLAETWGLSFSRKATSFHGELALGANVCLLKPTTYMNLSGQSVQALCSYYRIPTHEVLIIHDDVDLPLGILKSREGGGHGGHNGVRDIVGRLGSNMSRLKLGIGRPAHAQMDVAQWVLGAFSQEELDSLRENVYPEALARVEAFIQRP